MKALLILSVFLCSTLFLNAQDNIYAYYSLSTDYSVSTTKKNNPAPIVHIYENDPITKITINPVTDILVVETKDYANNDILLTNEDGAVLVSITVKEDQDTYKFDLSAYDAEILYLMTNGNRGLFMYTIDITGE
ncbi:MAG: hypothetical protein JXR53_00290 [Bacteroidales bacterium]|nr:hypothetical protein [Bacteroidales bacterium]